MSKDKITLLDIGAKDETKANVEQLKRELPNILELAQLTASIRRASYNFNIAQGFTPEEALELCKSPVGLV